MAKILAVDDSKTILDLIEVSLDDSDHDVTRANDGVEALRIAEAGSFDLVLTDINMPNMGGFDLIGHLRKLPKYASVPIVCITTESSDDLIAKSRAVGATGWIVKPFSPSKLLSTIDKLI